METLRLAAHARCCISGDWAVFLDLRGNRYWAAPASEVSQNVTFASGEMLTAEAPLAGELRRRGLIAPAPDLKPHIAAPPLFARVSLPAWADLMWALAWARTAVRRGTLEASVAELAALKRKASGTTSLALVWAQFEAARVWFPDPYVCLLDSLALAFYAGRRGARAELVFGVKARPFAAHCWIESEGQVINDRAEYCAAFTPILRA